MLTSRASRAYSNLHSPVLMYDNGHVPQELARMAKVREVLVASDQLTHGMTSILDSFERRLASLEQTVLPVYHETGNLQRRKQSEHRRRRSCLGTGTGWWQWLRLLRILAKVCLLLRSGFLVKLHLSCFLCNLGTG